MINPMTPKEALDKVKNTKWFENEGSDTPKEYSVFIETDPEIIVLSSLVSKFGDIPKTITIAELIAKLQPLFKSKLSYADWWKEETAIIIDNGMDEMKIVGINPEHKIKSINQLLRPTEQTKWLYAMWLNETEIIIKKEEGKPNAQ